MDGRQVSASVAIRHFSVDKKSVDKKNRGIYRGP